jgi:hypothetical protein
MRGEGGREHKKHVTTSRLLLPLVYVTEAQPLEKYDAEDAIARERDVGEFYADFRSSFSKRKETHFRCAEYSRRDDD